MKISLNLKTPIHIGDGREIYAYEYIFDNVKKRLYVYDFKNIVDILVETFENINLQRVKEIFFTYKKINGKTEIKLKELKNILKACNYFIDFKTFNGVLKIEDKEIKPIYTLRVLTNSVKDRIKTYIKTLNHAYIPGSEIKGALRTAFLYYLFKKYLTKNDDFFKDFQNKIRKYIYIEENNKKENQKKLKEIKLYEEIIQNKFLRDGKKDASRDFFKFIFVSDSYEKMIPENSLYVVNSEIFNSSKPGESVEVLKEDSSWNFDFEIDTKKLSYLINQVKPFKNSYKLIREEIKDISNIDCKTFLQLTKEFYKDLVDFEIWYWERGYGYFAQNSGRNHKERDVAKEKIKDDILNFYKNLKAELEENTNVFPIRIGKYINRYSHVILLVLWVKAIRENDNECRDLLDLAIKNYKNPFSFKTRRYLYNETKQKYLPFGWAYMFYKGKS